jgi:hypothetical protein
MFEMHVPFPLSLNTKCMDWMFKTGVTPVTGDVSKDGIVPKE